MLWAAPCLELKDKWFLIRIYLPVRIALSEGEIEQAAQLLSTSQTYKLDARPISVCDWHTSLWRLVWQPRNSNIHVAILFDSPTNGTAKSTMRLVVRGSWRTPLATVKAALEPSVFAEDLLQVSKCRWSEVFATIWCQPNRWKE